MPKAENPQALAVGNRLKRIRAATGLNQERLATVFGVTPLSYASWEQGRQVPSKTALMILADIEAGGEPTALRKLLADKAYDDAIKQIQINAKYRFR